MVKISFVVATYNPNWDSLIATLDSIINQVGVDFEIIIADDGSTIKFIENIYKYFDDKNFKEYCIVVHEHNVGTCINMYDGICKSSGELIKLISPGDFLFANDTMARWVEYFNCNKYKICFGKFVAYDGNDSARHVIEVRERPINKQIYLRKDNLRARKINYLLMYDVPVGATFLATKDLMLKYLSKIIGKVKYAEDFSYRLMVLDDIILGMYDEPVVYYEYGTGVSTTSDNKWSVRLLEDLNQLNDIILENDPKKDSFDRKYILYLKMKNTLMKRICKVLFFPDLVFWQLSRATKKKKTPDYKENTIRK